MNKRLLAILLVVAVLTGILALGAFAQEKKDPIRIFTIGNSHSNDSTWQLARVFAAQDPDREVIVGTMYYSGCAIERHVRYAYSNAKEYSYHKNVNGVWTTTKNCDLATALADEPWDIVVLQEMNVRHAQAVYFQNDNIPKLIQFVRDNLDNEPKFYWNMVWANPTDPTFWEPDFDPQPPIYDDLPGESWVPRYETLFGTDQIYMYELMVENVQNYIETNEDFYDVFYAGTAIQYANHMLGQTDIDLYRDYTHVSDLGRLMVAYLWYAKITGEPIEEVLVDVVPAAERCTWRQEALGDFVVTAEMKQVIKDAVNYTLENPREVPDPSAEDVRCAQCRYEPEWIAWDGTTMPTQGGHYYLTKDVTLDQQITLPDGFTVSLNLNGKTLTANSRAFQVCSGATLSIMDSVGTGKLQAAGVAGENGGVALVDAGGKLAIHGGLITNTETTNGINTGGLLYVNGDLTIRGGLLTGGKVTRAAENVYISATGTLTMAGGQITGGTHNDLFLRGAATLSRNARIDDICVSPAAGGPAIADMVTISGDFSNGRVGLEIMGDITDGRDIGNGLGAVFGEENVFLVDTDANFGIAIDTTNTVNGVQQSNLLLSEKRLCSHCEKDVVWIPIDETWQTNKVLNSGHYYLDFAAASYAMTERTVTAGHSVCLDLNGKGYTGTYRGITVGEGATLTILGNGWISGRGTEAGADGGVIYVAENATLNLYEATLRSEIGASVSRYADRGGVVAVDGVFNMYGGKVRGDSMSAKEPKAWPSKGGVIYVGPTGMLNVTGGIVNSGKLAEGGTGASIYSNGKVYLSADPVVDEVKLVEDTANGGPALGDMLEVGGLFTGSAVLDLETPKSGLDVGNLLGGGDPGNCITVKNSDLLAKAKGDDLVLERVIICQHCGEEAQWTAWNGTDALVSGTHYYLESDVQTGANELTAGDYAIDLRGNTLTSTSQAFLLKSGAKLAVMDTEEGGLIQAAGVAGSNGGTIYVNAGCEFTLFGGGLTLTKPNNGPNIGGVIYNNGTTTIRGGEIFGGEATTADTIYSGKDATLNIYGGTITGPDYYNTVYLRGALNLSGDPQIQPGIRLVPHSSGPAIGKMVTVEGNFTGSVGVDATETAKNLDIGAVASGVTFAEGSLTVNGHEDLRLIEAGGELVMAQIAYCQHCQEDALWIPVKGTSYWQTLKTMADGHYSLSFEANSGAYALTVKTIPANATVCIDLNGMEYQGTYRAFEVAANATLNIMGEGRLSGRGNKTFGAGAAIYVAENGTLNLYSGTLGTQIGIVTDRYAAQGGVLGIDGTFNMYGGAIDAVSTHDDPKTYPTAGGAVYVGATGVANLYAGTINSGKLTEDGKGASVYTSGKINLYGSASADEVMLMPVSGGPALAEMLTITGTYTGNVAIALEAPASGTAVGKGVDCILANGDLAISNSTMSVTNLNGCLAVWDYTKPFAVAGPDGVLSDFDSVEAAIEACGKDQAIVLMTDAVLEVAVSKDVTVDLNGYSLSLVTTGTGTVFVKDSKTNDYDVEDGDGYGIFSITGTANAAPASGYVKITEDGQVSFHKVSLDITGMSLRPAEAGLYFKSNFAGDQVVARNVESFGVALSVAGAPDETTLTNPKHFTSFAKELFGSDEENTSTLLTGVLKDANGYSTNLKNAATQVYGRAYIMIDGVVTFGETKNRSLREQMEGIDAKWELLSKNQKTGVLELYNRFSRIMSKWAMPNFQANQAEEEQILRVLSIGNSYSHDSTEFLYKVFASQNPDQKISIGVLYNAGCSVEEHLGYIEKNQAEYDYTFTDVNGKKTKQGNVVMDVGLGDQQWDIIVLQEASAHSGETENFASDNIEKLQAYVLDNVSVEPVFYWNMTWAWPQDPALRAEDYEPAAPAGWEKKLEQITNFDQMFQYGKIVNCVTNYILTRESFEKVIPVGTAIQYANNELGLDDLDLYRDYTHLNDYGRLIAAHVWYARLMGVDELTEVNVDVIPAHERLSRFQKYGDLVITEEMKQEILEAVNWALENPYVLP